MKWMARGMILIFMIRLVFSFLPSFQVDMGAWLAWANRLATIGPSHFYSDTVWTQYTPGFLYWLWMVGKLGWVEPLAIKVPTILADILTGYLIFKVIEKSSKRTSFLALFLYALNPIAIFNGSVWGQVDGILTLAMFGASYLMIEKNNIYASFALAALAFLIKLQAIAIAPVMIIYTFLKYGWKKTFIASALAAEIVVLGYTPFYPQNPIVGILDLIKKMGVSYPYTSLFAFNIWSYVGMWIGDSKIWMGQTYFFWGMIMSGVALLAILFKYKNHLKERETSYLLLALSCYIFFLFPTRVHERYLFPMFAYLFAYAGLKKNKYVYILVGLAIAVYLLNLYLPYSYYENILNPLKNTFIEAKITQIVPVLAAIQIGIFTVLQLFPAGEKFKKSIPVESGHRVAIKHR